MSNIISYLSFSAWLISYSMTISRSIHVAANGIILFFFIIQFRHLVMSDSLWPPWTAAHQASPSITNSQTYSNSSPLSQWCHPTISPSVIPFFSCLQSCLASIRVFSNESVFHIGWPKYWSFSFSISPSNEYSGLISVRMDWLDLLAVQGTLKSLL